MTTTSAPRELAPRYDAAAVEPRIYQRWMESGAFTPAPTKPEGAERFVIIQPPPNVTGALHLGHALTAFVEDILIRYHRMRGDDTLWLPGVDHASIAAQFVLDRILAEEGESRQSLGRERYLERMWRFMDETRDFIGEQHRRLGASLDWTRMRFTMDEGSARAVRVAFKRLWDAGLAYRGEALVNWCPRCRTTISDLENIKAEEAGTLWTIRYHLARADGSPDPDAWITVATTRPETLFGDTAVAVHPDDERYASLVGREAVLPFIGRRLPIIADGHVEREFGTGAVKVTPAHDFDDYEIGRRHGLPMVNVFDEEARLTEEAGPFAGWDRYDARKGVVAALAESGDLEGERPHQMVIGRCDRCRTVVEPRLSVQWFIRTKPLAERAMASVRERRTRIMPAHFEKVYNHWMENIHDWAVGRQLWWGHRIPAWYCPDGHITVTDVEAGPDACDECGRPAAELRQETDIFDTWFSSGLWPFSTLGWPDRTPDLERFYPTSVMETGYDILFFWVARMMMLGLFCTDVEPFHTVYLHGIVRDPYGQKMSKTKGNVVDPLQVVEEIGADALRFALVSGTSPGSDQRLTQARLEGGRNFTNKLWNAARFVLSARPEPMVEPAGEPTLPERWIRSRLAEVTERATRDLDELDLAGYVGTVYDFAWSEYCDWFLEAAKIDLRRQDASPGERTRVWRSLAEVLAGVLRLLHPALPFVTEEIWATLHRVDPEVTRGEELLITAAWPAVGARDAAAEEAMERVISTTRELRNLRQELEIQPAEWRAVTIVAGSATADAVLREAEPYISDLSRSKLTINPPGTGIPEHAAGTALGFAVIEASDAERRYVVDRHERERTELTEQIERVRALLASEFATKAPPQVVQRERDRLAELEARLAGLDEKRAIPRSGYSSRATDRC
ncbi:MAG TPA: valine--tRNA ligase [candidate division Zixibacteria bacterium]|nr:valine--tRNA ligase [candidate division Zixibacteria bacterium]